MNSATRNLAWKLNWYRQSELEGALLLGRMVRLAPDADTATRLLKHCADEARHAQLWSECIQKLDIPFIHIHRSYQSLFADHGGTPTNLTEVLAFTQIFERRVHKRFTTELAQPDLPEIVHTTYDVMIRDEHDHLDWVHTWLLSQPDTQALMSRYLQIDDTVYRAVLPHEQALWEITGLGDERPKAKAVHE